MAQSQHLASPQLPVGATFHGNADGWESNGISWQDYGGMSTHEHKLNNSRRTETPAWVNDDASVRETITLFMEERANLVQARMDKGILRNARAGSLIERLDAAQARMEEKRPTLEGKLALLCKRYGAEPENKKSLAILIENTDTQIRLIERGAALVLAVLHYYYRMGLDSVAIGIELGLKPPHVRQLLFRLNKTHAVVEALRAGKMLVIPHHVPVTRMALDAEGRTVPLCVECGQACKRKFCTRKCAHKHARKKQQEKRAATATPKHEHLKFCSRDCRDEFNEHPLETIKRRLGIDLDEVRREHGSDYAEYVIFCARLRQAPMPAPRWRIFRDARAYGR
jgi:hypothetical protein